MLMFIYKTLIKHNIIISVCYNASCLVSGLQETLKDWPSVFSADQMPFLMFTQQC